MSSKLFFNARIFTPADIGTPRSGTDQGELAVYENGALLVKDGRIIDIGAERDVRQRKPRAENLTEIDCLGRCMIPGFVDPHTHMCWAGLREEEFDMRLAGRSYLNILEKGGGILSTVRAVREADPDDLYTQTLERVRTALELGTTTMEIKSGYGLDTPTELKMLEVIAKISDTTVVDVVPTFLGAHAVPQTFKNNPDGFIDLIIKEMLPAVKTQGIAKFCDIFCEKGVFSIDQGRRLLNAAKDSGLGAKIHADEVHDLGGAGLAADIKAVSADHLLAAGRDNIRALAESGGVGVLLPATAYSLKKPYARARMMIENNLPVALATDCNPGSSFCESMPFVFGLAVMVMNMTPSEALTAATLNAAYAVGMADRTGSLDLSKQADFVLLDGVSPAILAYHAGVPPVAEVYKNGSQVG